MPIHVYTLLHTFAEATSHARSTLGTIHTSTGAFGRKRDLVRRRTLVRTRTELTRLQTLCRRATEGAASGIRAVLAVS